MTDVKFINRPICILSFSTHIEYTKYKVGLINFYPFVEQKKQLFLESISTLKQNE